MRSGSHLEAAAALPGGGLCGRLAREEPGQAAIEMALAMPLFLAVVFGMIQCSLVLQTYCNATYACRNAARFASLNSPTSLAALAAGAAAVLAAGAAATSATATQAEANYAPTQATAMVRSALFLNAAITPTVAVTYIDPATLSTGTNAVGQVVCVKASWTQRMPIPYMTTSRFTVGTQACKMISR